MLSCWRVTVRMPRSRGSTKVRETYGAPMTEEERRALLALTRAVVRALNARVTAEREALTLYHEQVCDRAECAYELLRVVHRADQAYGRSLSEAKSAYRRALRFGPDVEYDRAAGGDPAA